MRTRRSAMTRLVVLVAVSCLGVAVAASSALADPPSVTISSPASFTFASNPAQVTAVISGDAPPFSSQLFVNGVASGAPQSGPAGSASFSWSTTGLADGSYLLTVGVTDAASVVTTSAPLNLTVDQTPPLTSITSPSGTEYFQGSLPVTASASDAYGIASVQFEIDGTAAGSAITSPSSTGGSSYAASLDLTAFAGGQHALTEITTDNAGNTTTSTPVSFVVGSGPAVAITSPTASSFATKAIPVVASVTGGKTPYTSVHLLVDGVSTSVLPVASAGTDTFTWDSATVADGVHTLSVSVTDGNGVAATSGTVSVTVQNTPAEAVLYAPLPMPSYGYQEVNGATSFQVHASSAIGIKNVQFTVTTGGITTNVGPLRTASDPGQPYLYTISYDTTALTPGMHAVSAVVTDNAGNQSTAAPFEIKTGPVTYLPVLNYHGIVDTAPDPTDQGSAQAAAELKYLHDNLYQSVTLSQYEAWVATGALPPGITKPILITIDDGLTDELAWDPLLQTYGFTAVLFEATGFADDLAPGGTDRADNLTWAQIQALVATKRWEVAFHAGTNGHGDFSNANTSSVPGQNYQSTCWSYYVCLSQTKTTSTIGESVAALESADKTDIAAGIAELQQQIPTADVSVWACPWNACGQWTNQYNDTTNQVQAWAPTYFASLFGIVFTQTDPITYSQAPGNVGAFDAFNRRYRFEVDNTTTIAQFAAQLTDPGFAFYPPLPPVAPSVVSASAGSAQATVAFAAAATVPGLANSYTVTSSPGGVQASGAASPITVTGLTGGTSYTFTVVATNNAGASPPSTSSNAVTPTAPAAVVAVPATSTAGTGSTGGGGGAAILVPIAPAEPATRAVPITLEPLSVKAAAVASPSTKKATVAVTVSVKRLQVLFRGVKKPRFLLTLKLTHAGAFEVRLLGVKNRILARWTAHAKRGTVTFVLPLPARARHAGNDKLWISQIGKKTMRAALISAVLAR